MRLTQISRLVSRRHRVRKDKGGYAVATVPDFIQFALHDRATADPGSA